MWEKLTTAEDGAREAAVEVDMLLAHPKMVADELSRRRLA
jgi:hypothetical protein